MINSLIITGGTSQKRNQTLEKIILKKWFLSQIDLRKEPDFLLVQGEESTGILQTKLIGPFLKTKPLQHPGKVVLIAEAEKLTPAAQNNLLKTLEEPPHPGCLIVLLSPSLATFLPTVISRCLIKRLPNPPTVIQDFAEKTAQAREILQGSPGKRLQISQKIAQSREKTNEFVFAQIQLWRYLTLAAVKKALSPSQKLVSTKESLRLLKNLARIHLGLKQNINPKAALDHLLLSYPRK